MSREDLIKVIRAQEYLVEEPANEENKGSKFAKAEALAKKFQMKAALVVGVVGGFRSGYYKWISHRRVGPFHNPALVAAVEEECSKRNGVRGSRKIRLALYKRGMALNIKTAKHYMHYLNLRSTIRMVSSYRKPRAVIERRTDYIKRNFEPSGRKIKLYTDTITTNGQIRLYWSAVLADNGLLLDLRVSRYHDSSLIEAKVISTIKKTGAKFFLHSDNASFYWSPEYERMVMSKGGILSFGRGKNPFDNRKVEYLFSVLKQEYLRWFKDPTDIENAQRTAFLITLDYNLVREQSRYGWRSPIQNLR